MAWKCYECEHTNKGRNKTLCEACGMPFNVFADEAIKSRSKIKKLETELNNIKVYSDIYYDEASSKDLEIESLTNKLSQAIFQNKNLETAVNSQSRELNELNKKIISLNKQVDTRTEVNKDLSNSIERLQKKVNELESEKLLSKSKQANTSNEVKILIGFVCLLIAFFIGKIIGNSSNSELNPNINYAQIDSAAAIQPFILKDIYFENSAAPETFNSSFKSTELKYLHATLDVIPLSELDSCRIGFKIISPGGTVVKSADYNFYTHVDTVSLTKETKYISLSGFGGEEPTYAPGKYLYEVWLKHRRVGTAVFEVTN